MAVFQHFVGVVWMVIELRFNVMDCLLVMVVESDP
jgi:hypothetical protein